MMKLADLELKIIDFSANENEYGFKTSANLF